jgi:hypothetical protein
MGSSWILRRRSDKANRIESSDEAFIPDGKEPVTLDQKVSRGPKRDDGRTRACGQRNITSRASAVGNEGTLTKLIRRRR